MMTPKGVLVSAGGAERKGDSENLEEKRDLTSFEISVLDKILFLIEEGQEPIVEVVTTASSIPEEMALIYKEAFGKLGCKNVGHLNVGNRADTEKKEYLDRLVNCNIVVFTGGDPFRLSSIFGGTEFLDILKQRYENEQFIIAGTGGCSMALSNIMIHGGKAIEANFRGEVEMSTGFGFINNLIIDIHFDEKGRFNRLAQAVALHPGVIGVGLGEDTALIVTNGNEITAIGSGCITVIDGKNIKYSNVADIKRGTPISIENIRLHIMSNNDMYNIITRTFKGRQYEVAE